MSLEITEELIARQSPEAQAIIRLLLAQVARLEAKVADLELRLAKTPRNSSLPPSAQHPHAKPPTKKPKSKNKRGGHLKRDFQALVDSTDPQAKRLGRDLLRPTREMFRLWARYRDGTLTRHGWKRLMGPIRDQIDALLLRGAYSGHPRLVGMCRELYDHLAWLWTFLAVEGVEPTNNASERALRHAVMAGRSTLL
jgi:hypothetical protein